MQNLYWPNVSVIFFFFGLHDNRLNSVGFRQQNKQFEDVTLGLTELVMGIISG